MANNDLISRSALLAEYDLVHVGPPGGARKLIEEAPAWSPWADMEHELPMDGKSYFIIVSGKPRSNITLDHAYELATWYNDSGWVLDEWPEWEDTKVHAWAELPDPPEQEEDEVCEDYVIRYSWEAEK